MSRGVAERKRLIRITAGNVRQKHIYVNGHFDFFPPDCIGPPRKNGQDPDASIEIYLAGLDRKIRTDIGRDAATGKPRGFLRGRSWVKQFFEFHRSKADL
jgi:hypothetical protein